MQQFPVPKYIDLEAHILGPLSISQTVTVIIAGALIMVLYLLLETLLFIVAAIIVGFAAMIISFGKVNGRPMADFLFNVLSYNLSSQVYVWAPANKQVAAPQAGEQSKTKTVEKKARPASTVTPEQIHALAEQMDRLKK